MPGRPPSLEQDLSTVAWLQTSDQLSVEATGYVCDALLQWALLGEQWPDPAEPMGTGRGDHLALLEGVVERLVRRAQVVQPLAVRFALARVVRELATAVRCHRDPEGLAESQWRDLVHRMPWLTQPPAPVVLADGRVL